MSIRTRTELVGIGIGIGAGTAAATALAAAAAIHALWATGSAWPTSTRDELADLVVGRRPMPGRAACVTVAAALAGAAGATTVASVGRPGRLTDRSRTVAAVVSAALLVRGVGGLVAELAGVGDSTPAFRRWNRRLYSPLCVVLAILVAAVRRETGDIP